jgi:cyclopropane-fatty-acyl-phospholipid synthase
VLIELAREQAEYVRAEVRERKLEDLVEVQLCDYRDIPGGWFEAAVSLEMGEHVGDAEYPAFAGQLHRMLRPRGRLLIQQMSRRGAAPGGGAFIESYIAPDMHMRPVGETVALLEDAGLEVRSVEALREHYVHTVDAWAEALEKNWQQVTELAGPVTARVWRLYLAGGALAFEERRMGVDQILAVRPSERGGSGRRTRRHRPPPRRTRPRRRTRRGARGHPEAPRGTPRAGRLHRRHQLRQHEPAVAVPDLEAQRVCVVVLLAAERQ